MKTVVYTMMAARALRRHANRADMISDEIRQYAADPLSLANNVKVLAGADALRLRVGDFRILFTETNDTITILDIGPRGEIYS